MFEPVPVRRSRRAETKETAKRTEANLLQHIATLTTMAELGMLKAQMEAEMIPQTKAVKKALEKQEEEIAKEQEDEVASPREVAAMKRRLKSQLRKLGRKPSKSSLFFGPGTRRKSRGRRAMNAAREAAENAELTRLLEASENQQNAVGANAVAHAEAQEAAVQSPFFRVPGYNRAAYHELLGYPALQRAEAQQRRSLLPSLQPNGGPRTFTPEELREMELVGFPRWAAEQDAKRGGRRTRRKGRGRSRR